MNVNYLIETKPVKGNGVYFLVEIDVQSHTHPLYIGRMIKEKAASLGIEANVHTKVVAQWSGDLEENAERLLTLADKYENLKSEFPVQYYGNLKEAKKLQTAKEILETQEVL